jgi:hypothetical protein
MILYSTNGTSYKAGNTSGSDNPIPLGILEIKGPRRTT